MIYLPNRMHLLVLATFVILFPGCSSEHGEQQKAEQLPTVPVTIVTALHTAPVRQVEVMGSVQAADSAEIAARISGTINDLSVNPGSRVKKGELLVSISAGEITAKLLQAQAQFEQTERNLKREQNLLKKNAATPSSVKTLEESKRIAEAAYKEARTMLSYTSIKAPFDGVITRKFANVGDMATPGKPLVQLDNESRLQIMTNIPEALVLGISIGDTLPVYIPTADLAITGTIVEIAPTTDPRSRTAPVKLNISSDIKLRSGQFARVSLPGTRGSALMLPDSAVESYGQMDKVFMVKDGKARMQLVRTGLRFGDQLEIVSGINDGDQVVVSGHSHLKDGQPVQVQ